MAANDNVSRPQMEWASSLNLLAAIWLFISAFAIFGHGWMMINNILLGVVIGGLAAVRVSGASRQTWINWVNTLLSFWVMVSPWAVMGASPLGPTAAMAINNIATGGLIMIFSCWSGIATTPEASAITAAPAASPPA